MKICVICAPQTFGCNAGMFSVDLAAWDFLQRHFPAADVKYLTLYPHKCDFGRVPFEYATEGGDTQILGQFDLILFWGDFLHALPYRNEVASVLCRKGICSSRERALQRVREFLFLAGTNDHLLKRTVLYGGTLLFNPANAYDDETYTRDLRRLVNLAKGVWVRDPFSAFAVNQLQERGGQCVHGTDCAQLLRGGFARFGRHRADRIRPTGQKRLGIFIGRSHFEASKIAGLVSGLQADLPLNPIWLDWGRPPFFLDRRSDLLEQLPHLDDDAAPEAADTPLQSLMALQEVDVLISDTYHACVNAWNLGIPAICLIDDLDSALEVNSGSRAAGRDKRMVFYWTYNAAPFLIFSSELRNETSLNQRVVEISTLLGEQALIGQIMAQMSRHIQRAEDALVRILLS